MQYKKIPNIDLKVSSICLGSALFGSTEEISLTQHIYICGLASGRKKH